MCMNRNVKNWKSDIGNPKVAHSVDTPGRGFDLQGRLQQVSTMIKSDETYIATEIFLESISKVISRIFKEYF